MPRGLVADRQHLHPQAVRAAAAQRQEGEIETRHGTGMGERSKPAKKATTKAAPINL